jgi:SH3 domain protein
MKHLSVWFWMVLIGLSASATASMAETVYVTENFEITMRTGPGIDRKIISLVQSGNALEVIEEGKDWSQVRTRNGKEGWVLNRYLTPNEPCEMILSRLKQEYNGMLGQYEEMKTALEDIEEQKKTTDQDLSQSQQERDSLSAAYETLKKESSEFLNLKKEHQRVVTELEAEKTKSAKLDEENMQMKRSRIIQWVLTGGGIMLIGFFIGIFSSSRRKSRSSLY